MEPRDEWRQEPYLPNYGLGFSTTIVYRGTYLNTDRGKRKFDQRLSFT